MNSPPQHFNPVLKITKIKNLSFQVMKTNAKKDNLKKYNTALKKLKPRMKLPMETHCHMRKEAPTLSSASVVATVKLIINIKIKCHSPTNKMNKLILHQLLGSVLIHR